MKEPIRLAAAALALSIAAPARADTPQDVPRIDLYTMGEGRALVELFGHAAICVTTDARPASLCYNYGAARFEDPVGFVWDFVNGRAVFWVAISTRGRMERFYTGQDRSLWRQRLTLPPDQAQALADALQADRDAGFYAYHHYDANCTTKLRDRLDEATGGALRAGADARDGPSFRDYTRWGFAGQPALLAFTELFMGRAIDQPTNAWERMFLPVEFKDEVAGRLGDAPEVLHVGMGPPDGWARSGQAAIAAIGAALGAAIAVSRGRRSRRATLVAAALTLGGLGTILALLRAVSPLAELSDNEVLLVVWPTDLLLAALPGPWLRRYAALRLLAVAGVIAASLGGLLVQPLGAAAALAAPPLFAAWWIARRDGVS